MRGWGGLLSGIQNWGSMVKPGGKRTYQYIRTESSKVCHNDIYKNVSRYKSSSLANGLHGGTLFLFFIYLFKKLFNVDIYNSWKLI